jgi:hypothetical protein
MNATTRASRFDCASIGKSGLRLTVSAGRRLEDTYSLGLKFSGAERNTRVALACSGWRTGRISRPPDDYKGHAILIALVADALFWNYANRRCEP